MSKKEPDVIERKEKEQLLKNVFDYYPVRRLAKCAILNSSTSVQRFVSDSEVVLYNTKRTLEGDGFIHYRSPRKCPAFERAGPREYILFDPARTTAGIVTCGGVCPGLNNVIRELTNTLYYRYGVREILGLRFGFEGLTGNVPPVRLTPNKVKDIHKIGGTQLGTSRGHQDVGKMVDFLEENRIDLLFCIGGDGTLRGTTEISREVEKRKLKISVIAIPKTIDNDIVYTDTSFGFQTAVDISQTVIEAVHNEARSAKNGIGIVKLMGRDSGAIALHAALASGEVNLLLIPEVPFTIERVMDYLIPRLKVSRHAVIVVAEGAGQDILRKGDIKKDKSGNTILKDIGLYLRDELGRRFKQMKIPVNIKYIDPSYTIRAAAAGGQDAVLCLGLAQAAAHAALSGRTGCLISQINGQFVHVPCELVFGKRKSIDPSSSLYQSILDATGMPKNLHIRASL
eukprot:TRINITY_DN1097_c0_g1_i1.p1 TRINITY_DN1097_c0_g1~~TRINITY_DN1097_c0_g1_i1.p1  ORF type:complete len:455 (+),score=59.45 TRINITY_DN1097_c0_g1_i1:55-1419(+)